MLSMGVTAQIIQNNGFETWAPGTPPLTTDLHPGNWENPSAQAIGISGFIDNDIPAIAGPGAVITIGGSAGEPVSKETSAPAEGSANIRLTTYTVSGATGQAAALNGMSGAVISQVILTQTKAVQLVFEYKSNLASGVKATILVEGRGAAGTGAQGTNIVSQGILDVTGNNSSWVKDTVNLTYFTQAGIDTLEITIASTGSSLFNSGYTAPAADGGWIAVDDLQFLIPPVNADPVTNIVATDIADNGDGRDLQVTFDAAADEGTVSEYRIFVIDEGLMLGDWSGVGTGFYEVVTPDGSANYTHVFTAASAYSADQGNNSVAPEAIIEDVPMEVYVLSVADGMIATANQIAGPSNSITLDGFVGLTTESVQNAIVYPNPTQNQVNVITGFDKGSIVINSVTGQEVANGTILNGSSKVEVGS